MENVKGKTGFGWIELADVGTNPTDTDTSRGGMALVGSDMKLWNKSEWVGLTVTRKVSLTAQQIKALRATPETLVAAPGAGKSLEFVSATLKLNKGAAAFTEDSDNLAVKYHNGTGAAVSQTIETTGFIDQTADTQTNALAKIDAIAASAAAENKALVLHNTGSAEIAGNAANDGSVDIYVTYRVVDFS